MSPQSTTRTVGAGVLGVCVLLVIVGIQAASWQSDRQRNWNHGSDSFGWEHRSVQAELPPGQAIFTIPLDAKAGSFKEGNRINVLYQEEADTTAALIVQDVPVHGTYRGCRDPYPSVNLLLAKEDAERLGLLRDDGGKLIIRFTQPPASEE